MPSPSATAIPFYGAISAGSTHLTKMSNVNLVVAISMILGSTGLRAESSMSAPNVSVGSHLETVVKLSLGEGAPDDGLDITVRSADPARLLISRTPNQAGAASIVVQARQGFRESPEFWIQALDGSGTVNYTAEAAGFAGATGTVTLAPSAVMIVGPLRGKKFMATTGGSPTRLSVHTVRLDAGGKFEEQALAGGSSLNVEIANSSPSVGHMADPSVVIPGGASHVLTHFESADEGESTLSLKPPSGFGLVPEFATVVASVRKPGFALSDQVIVGQNLELGGVLSLGQYAGGNGVDVTLTSNDPTQLLLAASPTEAGSKSIVINIPLGEASARYYLQALGNSGTVTYTATAPGFRKRTAIVGLAPSGIIITPVWQGPPDEAHVLRAEAPESKSKFSVDLSQKDSLELVVWTAQLDPVTHRSADITVQPLRGGQTITIPLTNTNPAVGGVDAQVTIAGGSDHAKTTFKQKAIGSTEISIATPQGFTLSGNSTAVVGFVKK